MSDIPTPSQAEGERAEDEVEAARHDLPRTTPSQAEGEDTQKAITDNEEDTNPAESKS
jgi:hypothetical protein